MPDQTEDPNGIMETKRKADEEARARAMDEMTRPSFDSAVARLNEATSFRDTVDKLPQRQPSEYVQPLSLRPERDTTQDRIVEMLGTVLSELKEIKALLQPKS